jgi:hypothetical protein
LRKEVCQKLQITAVVFAWLSGEAYPEDLDESTVELKPLPSTQIGEANVVQIIHKILRIIPSELKHRLGCFRRFNYTNNTGQNPFIIFLKAVSQSLVVFETDAGCQLSKFQVLTKMQRCTLPESIHHRGI